MMKKVRWWMDGR